MTLSRTTEILIMKIAISTIYLTSHFMGKKPLTSKPQVHSNISIDRCQIYKQRSSSYKILFWRVARKAYQETMDSFYPQIFKAKIS